MSRSPITTHVLDLAAGRPGTGIRVFLRVKKSAGEGEAGDDTGVPAGSGAEDVFGGRWREIGRGVTDADGRVEDLLPSASRVEPGTYSLTFHVGAPPSPSSPSKKSPSSSPFFPEITITFAVTDPEQHYHVPLLLSPYGYSTYRGS